MRPKAKFYVYTLSDPRDGKVFYVGKGSRKRAHQHSTLKETFNKAKCDRIIAIIEAGSEPVVTIIEYYDNEADAFEHERELIATIDGLTNILSGYGWQLTREEAQRRADARAKIQLEKDREACRPMILNADAYFTALKAKGLRLRARYKPAQNVVDAIIEVTRKLAANYRSEDNKVDTK